MGRSWPPVGPDGVYPRGLAQPEQKFASGGLGVPHCVQKRCPDVEAEAAPPIPIAGADGPGPGGAIGPVGGATPWARKTEAICWNSATFSRFCASSLTSFARARTSTGLGTPYQRIPSPWRSALRPKEPPEVEAVAKTTDPKPIIRPQTPWARVTPWIFS